MRRSPILGCCALALVAGQVGGQVFAPPLIAAPPAALPSTCVITATVTAGARGPDVACLETQLIATGSAGVIGPDEYLGPSTTTAVYIFQAAHGLAIDGVVGPMTRAALVAAAAAPVASAPAVRAKVIETRTLGTSVEGRPITADRMGTPGGRVVMVIGIIHGDETKGALVTAALRTMPTPAGIDLWLIDSINPDGVANATRGNANGVDLNRNFSNGWSYIPPSTTNRQYSGEQPADQPETRAMEAFVRAVQPTVGIWFHQDANVVTINGARRVIPTLYGKLVGLGTGNVPCSAKCTGTAGSFANTTVAGSTNFLVELPGSPSVTAAMIRRHATAVLTAIRL